MDTKILQEINNNNKDLSYIDLGIVVRRYGLVLCYFY